MIVCGIDPGLHGAISFFRPSDGALHCYDMPTRMKQNGKREVDAVRVAFLVRRYCFERKSLALVENVGDGVFLGRKVSALSWFAFGKAVGAPLGALAALGVPVIEVRPAVWKALMGVTADKNTSRAMAQKLFPRYAEKFKRVKDDGRAEAALMAQYGVQQFL